MKTKHNPRTLNLGRRSFLLVGPLVCLLFVTLLGATNARAGADVDYALTAPADPVRPGETVEFDVTVRNLTDIGQPVTLDFTVPQFTSCSGHSAGAQLHVIFGTVAAHTSQSRIVELVILNGNDAPPDGTQILLTLMDAARAASVNRTVTVQSVQVFGLRLASTQAWVVPGQNFTYTLSASNISAGNLSGVQLSVPIPQGATFIAADGNFGVSGGVVTWTINTLAPAENRQFHLTLNSNLTPDTPLGAVVATLTDANGHIANASDVRAIDDSADFEYTITGPLDPVRPGDVVDFDVTVYNRTNSDRSLALNFIVPLFTSCSGHAAGAALSVNFGTVAHNASQTRIVQLQVLDNADAPPNGMPILLNLLRNDRAAAISRIVIVRSAFALDLQLATGNGTVAPGAQFKYTILTSNVSGNAVSGAKLQIPVPLGASFVSADGNASNTNNVVTWNIGSIAKEAYRQLHVTFKADDVTNTFLLPVEATLNDNANHFTRASDVRGVNSAPAFEYTISTPVQLVKPQDVVEFNVVARNRTNSMRSVDLQFSVPSFTSCSGHGAGAILHLFLNDIAAGASKSGVVRLNVLTGNDAPPNGTTITLNLIDEERGASISQSVIVGSIVPKADFNADSRPDWLLQNPSSRQTRIWLMNNGVLSSTIAGPTLPVHWTLIDTDQFNSANSADLLIFNSMTRQTAVWYMNGATFLGGRSGPTLPSGYILVLSHDFNGDSIPDLLIYNVTTHQLVVWYLNNLVQYTGGSFGPTLPAGWFVFGVADFNQDGYPDLLIWNPSRRSSGIWYLTNLTFSGSGYGPAFAPGWVPAALDDFNRDGHPDLAVANPSTHQTAIWYLNNNVRFSSKFGPSTPAGFLLTAPR